MLPVERAAGWVARCRAYAVRALPAATSASTSAVSEAMQTCSCAPVGALGDDVPGDGVPGDGVLGSAVRAVCGDWFVPTGDGEQPLPVCQRCEAEQPIAQLVLDLIRAAGPPAAR